MTPRRGHRDWQAGNRMEGKGSKIVASSSLCAPGTLLFLVVIRWFGSRCFGKMISSRNDDDMASSSSRSLLRRLGFRRRLRLQQEGHQADVLADALVLRLQARFGHVGQELAETLAETPGALHASKHLRERVRGCRLRLARLRTAGASHVEVQLRNKWRNGVNR